MWACSGVLGGLPRVVIEPGREVEGMDHFQGTIVSALRLPVAEAGVVDPRAERSASSVPHSPSGRRGGAKPRRSAQGADSVGC